MDKKRESEKLDEQKEPEEPMYSRVSRNLHTASLSISNEAFFTMLTTCIDFDSPQCTAPV